MSSPLRNKGNSWGGRSYAEIVQNPQYADSYTRWHWGAAPEQVREINDPRLDARGQPVLPDALTECGRLFELQFFVPGGARQNLTLPAPVANTCHLAFDPDHPYERLYILLSPEVEAEVAARFWHANPYRAQTLAALAKETGGRHAAGRYPALFVKPIGLLESFIYGTLKQNDGKSLYKHRAGEESGIRPCLAADAHGRLWVAGGNYTSPTAGVTD